MTKLPNDLQRWLEGAERVVVLGVGNSLRMDDALGIHVAKALEGKVPDTVKIIEAETVPESFLGPIQDFKPTHVIIVDAAMMGLPPGEARLLSPEETLGESVSSHVLPLYLVSEYLEETLGAKIIILAVQPKETSFGEEMTPELRESASEIVQLLSAILFRIGSYGRQG